MRSRNIRFSVEQQHGEAIWVDIPPPSPNHPPRFVSGTTVPAAMAATPASPITEPLLDDNPSLIPPLDCPPPQAVCRTRPDAPCDSTGPSPAVTTPAVAEDTEESAALATASMSPAVLDNVDRHPDTAPSAPVSMGPCSSGSSSPSSASSSSGCDSDNSDDRSSGSSGSSGYSDSSFCDFDSNAFAGVIEDFTGGADAWFGNGELGTGRQEFFELFKRDVTPQFSRPASLILGRNVRLFFFSCELVSRISQARFQNLLLGSGLAFSEVMITYEKIEQSLMETKTLVFFQYRDGLSWSACV